MTDSWDSVSTDSAPEPQGDPWDSVSTSAPPTPPVKPKAPQRLPDAFLNRFATSPGTVPGSTNDMVGKQRAIQKQQAIDLGTALKEGYGDEPTGWSDDNLKALQEQGWIDMSEKQWWKVPQTLAITGIPWAADAITRGANALINAASTAAGQTTGEIKPGQTAGNSGEMYQMLNWMMIDSMAKGGGTARIETNPVTGKTEQVPVGSIPKTEDFKKAGEILEKDRPGPTVENAWKQSGVAPSEVINDSHTDPTIKQDVLTNQDIKAYQQQGPLTPEQWVNRNVPNLFSMDKDAFEASVKESGLTPEEVAKHLEERPEAPVSVYPIKDGKGSYEVSWIDPEYNVRTTARSDSDGTAFKTEQDALNFANKKATKLYDGAPVYVGEPLVKPEAEAAKPEEPTAPEETPVEAEAGKPMSLADAKKSIRDKISIGEDDYKAPMTYERLYTRFIDGLNPVRVAFRQVLKQLGVNRKAVEGTAEDPYTLFRLTKGIWGKGAAWLRNGTRDYFTGKVNGIGLEAILKPFKKDLNNLREYLVSKRAIELHERGIDSGFDVESAKMVVEAGKDTYEETHRALVDFQNRVAKYYKDAGMLSEEAYANMLESNKDYTPFYRHFLPEENMKVGRNTSNRLGTSQKIKKIKGSDRDVIDPLESVIKNTYTYLHLADKNAAGLKLVDWMNKADDSFLELLETDKPSTVDDVVKAYKKDKGDNTISVYRDGVRETYKVGDPDLVQAWRGLDQTSASLLIRLLAQPARFLRGGATLTPDFMARNLVRDLMSAVVNTGGTIYSPIDSFKGFWGVVSKSDKFWDWQSSGGANAAMVSMDRRYIQENLFKLNQEAGLLKSSWNIVSSPLRMLQMTSELIENSTRLGEYMKLAKESKSSMQEAAYSSREVTLDFARIGSQMKAANMIDAFLNANIQGTDRMLRAFKEKPFSSSIKTFAGITVPSILLWQHNHTDERYKNLPDWEKDLYWIVPTNKWEATTAKELKNKAFAPWLYRKGANGWEINNGTMWRIPKPFELGVLFGSGPERMLDAYFDKQPDQLPKFLSSLESVLVPQVIPTFLAAPYETWANKSMFTGAPIVNDYLAQQLPEYQFNQYTSETAKAVARFFTAFKYVRDANSGGNVLTRAFSSPLIMENWIKDWTGGTGQYVLNMLDAGLGRMGIVPRAPTQPSPGRNELTIGGVALQDIPGIRSFTVRYPNASVQSLTDFKQRNDGNTAIMNTFKLQMKNGNWEAGKTVMENYGMRANLDGIQTTINQLGATIGKIYQWPDKDAKHPQGMTADDKRQLIDSIYYKMIRFSMLGNQFLDKIDANLKKAGK